jgi:hypothetical protein
VFLLKAEKCIRKKKIPKKKSRAKIRNSSCGPKCKSERENPERNE